MKKPSQPTPAELRAALEIFASSKKRRAIYAPPATRYPLTPETEADFDDWMNERGENEEDETP